MPSTIHFVYHRPGKGTSTFEQRLVVNRPQLKVLIQEPYRGSVIEVGGIRVLEPGSQVTWFVIPNAWYDIGRFTLADGTFTGWYTNLCTPVEFASGEWVSTDLFLDLWQPARGEPRWLDVDEFDAAVADGHLSPELTERAREARAEIDAKSRSGRWPPAEVLDAAGHARSPSAPPRE